MYKLGDVTGLGYEKACVIFKFTERLLLIIPCKMLKKYNKYLSLAGSSFVALYVGIVGFIVWMQDTYLLFLFKNNLE